MKKIDKTELHNIFIELKNNKESSFNDLYTKYNKLIYNIAFSILKNRENSEDIVQIVFTKIYKMDKEKLPTSNESSWIYTLTKNETLNYIRKQRNDISLDEIDYIVYEDNEIEEIIDKDTYNKIIKKLDKIEREIVSLKIISDMKFKDIAKLLNMPIGTVQWKYYTALHSLKLLLGNISMVIMGAILFVVNRTFRDRLQENSVGTDMPSEEIINKIKDDKNEISSSNVNSSDSIMDLELENQNGTEQNEITNREVASSINDNILETNEIKQEHLENNTVIEEIIENNITLNNIDIGILTFSGFFLVFCIIFLIIYIKHQQKGKNKVSK